MPKRKLFTFLEEAEAEPREPDAKKPKSEESKRTTAEIDSEPDDKAEFVRYFLEQTIREAMVDAYLDGSIVGYKRRHHGAEVPEDLMEQLREEAKAVWYEPLDPEDEATLEEMQRAICSIDS